KPGWSAAGPARPARRAADCDTGGRSTGRDANSDRPARAPAAPDVAGPAGRDRLGSRRTLKTKRPQRVSQTCAGAQGVATTGNSPANDSYRFAKSFDGRPSRPPPGPPN